jgi:hypothetical protein
MKLDITKAFLTGLCNPGQQDVCSRYSVQHDNHSAAVHVCADLQRCTTLYNIAGGPAACKLTIVHAAAFADNGCVPQISSTVDMLINLCHT